LDKKFAVFSFYPGPEEDVEIDDHDCQEEMPQVLPDFTPLVHLCEAISEGFSPSPRISALNLPLGVMIEVLDENLCDVIQGTLRLRARTLISFLADAVGHHELITFAQPPVNIQVNAISTDDDLQELRITTQLDDYLKEMKFRGVVLDFIGGSSPSMSFLAKYLGAFYPVADSDTAIDLSELKARGVTHFIDKQSLYCCWEAPNRGELDNAELPAKQPELSFDQAMAGERVAAGCSHHLSFSTESKLTDGWTRYSNCSLQPSLKGLRSKERAILLSRLREINNGQVTEEMLTREEYV